MQHSAHILVVLGAAHLTAGNSWTSVSIFWWVIAATDSQTQKALNLEVAFVAQLSTVMAQLSTFVAQLSTVVAQLSTFVA